MPVTVQLGGPDIDLKGSGDLEKYLSPGVHLILAPKAVTRFFKGTLRDAGNAGLELELSPNLPVTWDLGANGGIVFELKAEGAVTVAVTNSGAVFDYYLANTGAGDPEKKTVSVPPGMAYVKIAFRAGLGASAGGPLAAGNFGLDPELARKQTFEVANYKAFPADTPAADAIRETFASFILPFQPDTAARIAPLDFISYETIATLAASVTVSYGVSASLLGGRGASEIQKAAQVELGGAVLSAAPAVSAAVSFGVSYDHKDTFRILAGRPDADARQLWMWVLRAGSRDFGMAVDFGAHLSPGFALALDSGQAVQGISSAAFANAGPVARTASAGLKQALEASSGAVQDYLKDTNTKVAKFFGADFSIAWDRIRENTAVMQYSFDLDTPEAVHAGYALAVAGDFRGAMTHAGVRLAPGSFVENALTHRTAAKLQFFDIALSRTDEYFTSTDLIYAGDGVFRLIGKAGERSTTVGINRAANSAEVYFTAEAREGATPGSFTGLDIKLNFVIADRDRRATAETANALLFMGDSALEPAAARLRDAGQGTLACVFTRDAYTRVACDEYSAGKPPREFSNDVRNYQAFIDAVRAIVPPDSERDRFLRVFGDFHAWQQLSIAQNGRPDRHATLPVASMWPENLKEAVTQDSDRTLISSGYLMPAQAFMNFCESLNHLASPSSEGQPADWDRLLASLEKIIKNGIDDFMIQPALGALFRVTGSVATDVHVQSGNGLAITFTATRAATAPA